MRYPGLRTIIIPMNQAASALSAVPAMRFHWTLIPVLLLLAIFLMPVIGLLQGVTTSSLSAMEWSSVQRYAVPTLLLTLGVLIVSGSIGTVLAWLVTHYAFPGRRILQWAAILPLAVPAYILALTYGALLDSSGIVQTFIREHFQLSYGEYYFPAIRSLGGAIFILSLAFYPYVYLLARAAFRQQSAALYDAGRMLALNHVSLFYRLTLPAARPAILVGLALVGMETLAEFGSVSLYGVSTFTAGIYKYWLGMGDLVSARQLALILMLFVITLVSIERHARGDARYTDPFAAFKPHQRIELSGWKRYVIPMLVFIPVALGFIIPTLSLVHWSFYYTSAWFDILTWQALWHSLLLGLLVAAVTLCSGLVFNYFLRYSANGFTKGLVRFSVFTYALPGSVIAVGIAIPLLALDHMIGDVLSIFNIESGLIFAGTLFAVVLACAIRFHGMSLSALESGLQRLPASIDDSARMLGTDKRTLFKRVHLPLLKNSLLAAAIFVFVDTIKELPATLMLRPFNYDTLAIRAYDLAGDEQLYAASPSAILMIALCMMAVLVLNKKYH